MLLIVGFPNEDSDFKNSSTIGTVTVSRDITFFVFKKAKNLER